MIGDEFRDHHGIRHVPVQCSCGTYSKVSVRTLEIGKSKSCGCWRRVTLRRLHRTHGQRPKKLYWVWAGMIQRCTNPRTIGFKDYGGRGIRVCAEWRRSFVNFRSWAVATGYRAGLQLDRKRVNENYCPSNCRWVTRLVQANNRRRRVWEGTSFNRVKGKWMAYADFGPPGRRKRQYLGFHTTRVKAKQAVESWRHRAP